MRKSYIDTMKLFAAFIVFMSHFISELAPVYMPYFERGKEITLLNGVSGKLGVSFFGICLGYFAYLSKEKNPTIYILKRYFYFFFCGFFINVILSLYRIFTHQTGYDFFYILINSLRLGDRIFDTYWCMPAFFMASLLSYVNGQAKVSEIGILFQIVFLYIMGQEWIAICLLGAIAAIIINKKNPIFSNPVVKITVLIFAFFAIKRPECKETYFIDGLCSAALLLVVENSAILQRLLSAGLLANNGKNVMAIFLIHPLTYTILGNYLMSFYAIPYGIRFFCAMMICWIVIVGLSYPITYIINHVTGFFNRHIVEYAQGTPHQA